MNLQIIMWTMKSLDTECYTVKVLQALRGVAILIIWLGTAGLNRVFEEYINLFQFNW